MTFIGLTERIIGRWLNLRRNRNNIVLATKVAGPSAAAYFGLDPAQMAIAYVTSRPFVTSNIIGATTLGQLKQISARKPLSSRPRSRRVSMTYTNCTAAPRLEAEGCSFVLRA